MSIFGDTKDIFKTIHRLITDPKVDIKIDDFSKVFTNVFVFQKHD